MFIISIVIAVIILIILLIIWKTGLKKKQSITKLFLKSTVFLFSITLILLGAIWATERQSNDIYLFGKSLNEGLIVFSMWFYLLPVLFLIITIVLYLVKRIKFNNHTAKL